VPAARWFSASARVMGDGSGRPCCPSLNLFANRTHTADLALSQKLAEELKYEQEAATEAEEPEFLTAFKKRGVWQV
jgi:complement component 1 Q subcomponent-binding protein